MVSNLLLVVERVIIDLPTRVNIQFNIPIIL